MARPARNSMGFPADTAARAALLPCLSRRELSAIVSLLFTPWQENGSSHLYLSITGVFQPNYWPLLEQTSTIALRDFKL